MAFKLGKARQPLASGGVVNKKLSFNMDGSIYISDQIQPGSQEERQVLLHEMRHATDMKLGKLAYNDDSVYYDGITYPRETINGKDMIKVDGKWKEAGDDFPWEKTASI
jgi:hypothetical protein